METLPGYVTNNNLKLVCVADACGQPAEQVLVLTIAMSSHAYHLPVCMLHASVARASGNRVG